MNEDLLFPYEKIRPIQEELIEAVEQSLEDEVPLIVHAPTGLGKTAATLAPAITYAKKNKKTIFFLTSRHTQHLIALETVKAIKERFKLEVSAVSVVGKRNLCAQSGIELMRSDDFTNYCKSLREDGKCSYYTKARSDKSQPTMEAEQAIDILHKQSPLPSEEILTRASADELCPYEISLMLADKADVIVADYNYLFNERIRMNFLGKINKQLSDSIIIIDEGHNLPARLREQLTRRLSSMMLKRAIQEAKKYEFEDVLEALVQIQDILNHLSGGLWAGQQKLVNKHEFLNRLNKLNTVNNPKMDLTTLHPLLEMAAETVREDQRSSAIGGVANFLAEWSEGDEGFSRMISVKEFNNEPLTILSCNCLDPSISAKEVVEAAHTTILMSGTLMPTSMFKDLLGFPEYSIEREFESPFPPHHRECLVVPGATTKYTSRNEAQYKKIAEICNSVVNFVPGCSAIFFPSYALRDSVANYLNYDCNKTVFMEERGASKESRQQLIKDFSSYKKTGAVLLGVASGSFGEGVDMPGILKSVIVVGIPLDKPDLETKELIMYYDKKYRRGWDYGYILPAITKTLQNAGRCIRSETDKGVLVFLDDRYLQPQYARCFPRDWEPQLSKDPKADVQDFFGTFG
jgi:DNA excision repair protein ERCC-2